MLNNKEQMELISSLLTSEDMEVTESNPITFNIKWKANGMTYAIPVSESCNGDELLGNLMDSAKRRMEQWSAVNDREAIKAGDLHERARNAFFERYAEDHDPDAFEHTRQGMRRVLLASEKMSGIAHTMSCQMDSVLKKLCFPENWLGEFERRFEDMKESFEFLREGFIKLIKDKKDEQGTEEP